MCGFRRFLGAARGTLKVSGIWRSPKSFQEAPSRLFMASGECDFMESRMASEGFHRGSIVFDWVTFRSQVPGSFRGFAGRMVPRGLKEISERFRLQRS